MKLKFQTKLSASPEKVFSEVKKPSLLLRIAEPMATILPVDGKFPDNWEQGVTYVCRIRIFKWIPIGKRHLKIETIDDNNMEIQSREFDPLVRKWDHLIRVEASGNETLYSDELDIEAGILTPFVCLYAWIFYRHRQRRWRAIAVEL